VGLYRSASADAVSARIGFGVGPRCNYLIGWRMGLGPNSMLQRGLAPLEPLRAASVFSRQRLQQPPFAER